MQRDWQWLTAEEYTHKLHKIGSDFSRFFGKRRNFLPLHIQIVCGYMDGLCGLEKLLSAKPYLANVRDDFGRTPMMVCWHDCLYDCLHRFGANPNQCDNDGNTVLMYHRNSMDRMKKFLAYGADINARNKQGDSLITIFLKERRPIRPLLDAGAIWQPIEDKDNAIFLHLRCTPKTGQLASV